MSILLYSSPKSGDFVVTVQNSVFYALLYQLKVERSEALNWHCVVILQVVHILGLVHAQVAARTVYILDHHTF